jgi:arylsulfatase A-like enzyme
VPLILSWKGATPAGVVDSTHLASGADILPTMCDYAGIPHPRMTGASLKPVIQNPRKPGSEFVVAELAPDPKRPDMKGRMVRTRRYKYIAFSLGKNPEMLFDADADPGETRNLAGHPAMKATLAEHRSLLAKWCAQTADSFQLPSHD